MFIYHIVIIRCVGNFYFFLLLTVWYFTDYKGQSETTTKLKRKTRRRERAGGTYNLQSPCRPVGLEAKNRCSRRLRPRMLTLLRTSQWRNGGDRPPSSSAPPSSPQITPLLSSAGESRTSTFMIPFSLFSSHFLAWDADQSLAFVFRSGSRWNEIGRKILEAFIPEVYCI